MNAMGEAVMVGMVSWGYFAHTFLYLIFLSSHVEKIKQKRPNPPYSPLKFWGVDPPVELYNRWYKIQTRIYKKTCQYPAKDTR